MAHKNFDAASYGIAFFGYCIRLSIPGASMHVQGAGINATHARGGSFGWQGSANACAPCDKATDANAAASQPPLLVVGGVKVRLASPE